MLKDNVKITIIGGAKNGVIHKNNDDEINFVSINEAIINTNIIVDGNEIIQVQECIKCMISKSPELFESIKFFEKLTNVMGVFRAFRLMHEDNSGMVII